MRVCVCVCVLAVFNKALAQKPNPSARHSLTDSCTCSQMLSYGYTYVRVVMRATCACVRACCTTALFYVRVCVFRSRVCVLHVHHRQHAHAYTHARARTHSHTQPRSHRMLEATSCCRQQYEYPAFRGQRSGGSVRQQTDKRSRHVTADQ